MLSSVYTAYHFGKKKVILCVYPKFIVFHTTFHAKTKSHLTLLFARVYLFIFNRTTYIKQKEQQIFESTSRNESSLRVLTLAESIRSEWRNNASSLTPSHVNPREFIELFLHPVFYCELGNKCQIISVKWWEIMFVWAALRDAYVT